MNKYLILSLTLHGVVLGSLAWVQAHRGQLTSPQQNPGSLSFELLDLKVGETQSANAAQDLELKAADGSKTGRGQVTIKEPEHANAKKPQKPNTAPIIPEEKSMFSKQSTHPRRHGDINGETKVSANSIELQGPEGRQAQMDYTQQLKLFFEKHKRYPRQARKLKQTGLVQLRLMIDADGRFRHVEVIKESPHPSLNQAALELVKSLGHFKPLPEHISADTDFRVPIAYQLSGARL